jgi:hypothetical protein
MVAAQEPNWLIVIGFVYIAYAFGLLALAAAQNDVTGDSASRAVADAKQRTCFTFAGLAGMLGAGMQILGQGIYVGRDLSIVVILLGLVVLLLGYLAFSERMVSASRLRASERRTELAVVPRAGAGTYGQAAE